MNPLHLRTALIAVCFFAGFSSVSAQVTWDGSGGSTPSNTSGDWVTPANWTTDTLPSISTNATLGDVTTGTRTISIKSGDIASVKTLTFTQTTATTGVENVLSIASGGTLNLGGAQNWVGGSVSGGTARVELGGTIDITALSSGVITMATDFTFTNAGAVLNRSASGGASTTALNFNGNVIVNASGGTAKASDTSAHSITATFASGKTLLVNSGTLEFTTNATSATPGIAVTLGGGTTITAGAGITLTTDSARSTSSAGSAGVTLANAATGTLTHAGTITTNARGASGVGTLTNSGIWKVSGTGAAIQKMTYLVGTPTPSIAAQNPTFANSAAAVFTGSTAADKITYNHLQTPGSDLAFTNSGIIAAGNGSNLTGLTSVGTLTFVDFAITNSVTTSSLVFDIGGTIGGQFDVIALQSGSLVLTNATLAINLVNGFTPSSSFSLNILTSDVPSSISGSFVGLTVNGSANSDYSFTYNSTTGIGTLSYSAIPEPSTYAVAAGLLSLGVGIIRCRRTGKASV